MNQNNTNPLVSIIINCYNGEKFLFEALDSVIKQTYKNWEVIFWDNHSTDQSKKNFFSYNEPRFRYYLADNHTNLYTARNLAIDKSKGEFIAFLDTDDWWEDTKLSKQLDYFKDSEVGLVYGNCWIVDERKRNKKIYIQNKKKLPTGFIFNQLLKEYVISLPTIIIRKKIIKNEGKIFNGKYHIIGDFDLSLRLSLNWKIECCQSPIAYNRIHGSNESILKYAMQTNELEDWIQETSLRSKISYKKKLDFVNLVNYRRAKENLDHDIKESIKFFGKISLGFLKFKMLAIILLKVIKKIIIKK